MIIPEDIIKLISHSMVITYMSNYKAMLKKKSHKKKTLDLKGQ